MTDTITDLRGYYVKTGQVSVFYTIGLGLTPVNGTAVVAAVTPTRLEHAHCSWVWVLHNSGALCPTLEERRYGNCRVGHVFVYWFLLVLLFCLWLSAPRS